jgi:hypothetical protein
MTNRQRCMLILLGSLLSVLPGGALAQDRVFNYTYQSTVLGKSQREIEVWNTLRWGRSEFFRALDHRLEFETGLGGHLQTSFYLNIEGTSSKETSAGVSSLQSSNTVSFSNEWKYAITDPFADPVGFALYAEITIGTRAIELEPKLIVDKNYGSFLVALNVTGEFEVEKKIDPDGTEETGKETRLDVNLAAAVSAGFGVHLGLEAVNRNGFSHGTLEYSTLYAGPTVSYVIEGFWINATFLPQLVSFKGATDGSLVLNAQQRYEARVVFSYAL